MSLYTINLFPSTDENWENMINIMEYYMILKSNELLILATKCMILEAIDLRKPDAERQRTLTSLFSRV